MNARLLFSMGYTQTMNLISHHRRIIFSLVSVLAFACLFVILTLPNQLARVTPQIFVYLPLELMIIGLFLLIPGRAGDIFRLLLTILLGLGILLRVADLVTHQIFARRFNLIFDTHLLADGSRLLTGVLGDFAAVAAGLIIAAVTALLCWLVYVMLRHVQNTLRSMPRLTGVVLTCLLLIGLVLQSTGSSRAGTFAWDELAQHSRDTVESFRDIREFAVTVNQDEWAERSGADLFDRLQGKDVLVVFAESYGRILLEREPFADAMRASLQQAQSTLEADGAHMRSAFLTAPTVGGLSWLAHASVLSGAWIDSETRYESLIISRRATLNRLFRDAGWRTVAAMPAITIAWPEGNYYGYDHIYHAHNFGYKGLPFNWVTMPDQYVWSALYARELHDADRRPVMAELTLISSHAPWTPIAQVVPWEDIDDGRIFNDQAQSGPSPEEVWADVESIRDHYRQSIEYMLATLVSYIESYGDKNLVVLVMGDHPPAPMVSGDTESREVPVHLISHDPAVIDAISDWQWQSGLIPDNNAPVWRMDSLRDRFIEAFSSEQVSGQ